MALAARTSSSRGVAFPCARVTKHIPHPAWPLLQSSRPLAERAARAWKGDSDENGGGGGNGNGATTSGAFPLAQLATVAAALALGATAVATQPEDLLLDLQPGQQQQQQSQQQQEQQAAMLKQWRGQRTGGAAQFSSSSSSSSSSSRSVPSTLMIATVDGQPFALDADLVPGGAEALRRSAAAAKAAAEEDSERAAAAAAAASSPSSASAVLAASPAISSGAGVGASEGGGSIGGSMQQQSPPQQQQQQQQRSRLSLLQRRAARVAAQFSPGDALAAAMWSVAYWYVSPTQLLLIFLGRIEPERSSDWLQRRVGLPGTLAVCGLGGLTTAVVASAALGGSATWGVAGGLGAAAAAAFIEIGRPKQLNEREVTRLLARRAAFGAWADARLSPAGNARCHEREILAAFRRDAASRRAARRAAKLQQQQQNEAATDSEEEEDDDDAAWDEQTVRELVRAWAPPGAERSRSGYWRGVGLLSAAAAAAAGGEGSR
jgi:hypothetical protein